MRRLLLASVSVIGISSTAMAQGIPVWDNAQIIQRAMQFGQTAQSWATQARQMKATYDQVSNVVTSLTGPRPMDGVAASLGMVGIYLPGLQSGSVTDAFWGMSSYGAAAQTLQRNMAAIPTNGELDLKEILLRQTGLANRWENAMAAFRVSETRNTAISELRAKAGRTMDLQESMALQNRIAAEQAALTNEADRAQYVIAMQQIQDRVQEARDREAGRLSSLAWAQSTQGAWNVRW